jgi:hypothetical protein
LKHMRWVMSFKCCKTIELKRCIKGNNSIMALAPQMLKTPLAEKISFSIILMGQPQTISPFSSPDDKNRFLAIDSAFLDMDSQTIDPQLHRSLIFALQISKHLRIFETKAEKKIGRL